MPSLAERRGRRERVRRAVGARMSHPPDDPTALLVAGRDCLSLADAGWELAVPPASASYQHERPATSRIKRGQSRLKFELRFTAQIAKIQTTLTPFDPAVQHK